MTVLGLELWHILLASIITLFFVKKLLRKSDNMPPHVPGIPILGNIFQVNPASMGYDLTKLTETYGEIFTFNLFGQKVVSLNSARLILKLYEESEEAFLDGGVTSYAMQEALYDLRGVGFRQYSSTYQLLRKTCIHAIMMAGEKRKQTEMLMQEEAEALVERLEKHNGESMDPQLEIETSILNVISVLTIGRRFDIDDPDYPSFQKMVKLMNLIISPSFGTELDMLPFLRWFPLKSMNTIKEFITVRDEFMDKSYKQNKEKFQKDSLQCMADHMINYVNENPDGDVTEVDIKAVLLDMLVAGVLTTSAATLAAIAVLVNNQDIQEKIQDEIDQVIGHSQMPSMEHKCDLPYLGAFILDILRYASVVGVSIRSARYDTNFSGYFIPKGTMLAFNIFGVQHDSVNWKDPYKVDPGRFLSPDGRLVSPDHPNRKQLYGFGGGKRICIGEKFAKKRMFLFLCSLLQRFKFLPADGAPAPVDDPWKYVLSLVTKPHPFKVKIVKRT